MTDLGGGVALIENAEGCNTTPAWPGGASGVTIGRGYDLGYESAAQIRADWGDLLPASVVNQLASCSGITGVSAAPMAVRLAGLHIPVDVAHTVFINRTLPRYTAMTVATFPHVMELPPDCLGALVATVYNRGTGMVDKPGDVQHRRSEMRAILAACTIRAWTTIPFQFESMKRLWRNVGLDGLITRYENTRQLFLRGLGDAASMKPAPFPFLPVRPLAPIAPSTHELTADDLNNREAARLGIA